MVWQFVKELIKFPVKWFWKYYKVCRKENDIGKMLLLFLVSLTGVGVVVAFLYLIICFVIDWCVAHPVGALGILGVGWLYTYVKENEPEQAVEEVSKQTVLIQEKSDWQRQAEQGYATMLNVIYQTLRVGAKDVGGVTPTFMGEIEMPDGRYRISNGIVYYNFMLQKQDVQCIYDEKILNEFKNTLQYIIHNKLHSGAFPTVSIVDYRDSHGGMDGIVVHTLEDYGRYLVIYTTYASPEYSEYRYQQELLKTQRSPQNNDLTTSWDDV